MLVHGAKWVGGIEPFHQALDDYLDNGRLKRSFATRLLGYGEIDFSRLHACTESRATIIGFGVFDDEGYHRYRLPIPQFLSETQHWRQLTVSLAWLTPINPRSKSYRGAALTLAPTNQALNTVLGVTNRDADGNTSRRGTVQHFRFAGSALRAFQHAQELEVDVECRGDALEIDGTRVRYGVVMSLEVEESLNLQLYQDVSARIRDQFRLTTPITVGVRGI
jgi:hypothetical protein